LLRGAVKELDTHELEVDTAETGGRLRGLGFLLEHLEEIHVRRRNCHLRVRFTTDNVYIYGLCAIAAWASQNAADLEFTYTHDRVRHFLHRTGVIEGLRNPEAEPFLFDDVNFLGFTRIDPQGGFEIDQHAGRLAELLATHSKLSPDAASSFATCFAELIENCLKHGAIGSSAWLFDNYHPQPRRMHICICDRGMGVRASFEQSADAALRAMAEHPTHWIRHATEPLVTSKSSEHAGYGLYVVRELCKHNGGEFLLLSDRAAFSIDGDADLPETASPRERMHPLPFVWRGTILAVSFDLNRPLDIGEVYRTLPPPRGYTESDLDFFQ